MASEKERRRGGRARLAGKGRPGDRQSVARLARRASSPAHRTLRAAALTSLFALATDSAHAVIPGIAPGLVAILPQLLILLVTVLALLVSPRAWWRGGRWVIRHPLRSATTAGCLVLALVAARALAGMWPRSLPGTPLAETAAGLPIGDLRASRVFLEPGPRSMPRRRDVTLPDSLRGDAPWRPAKLAPIGGDVLVRDRRGLHVARFDPEAENVLWETELEAPAALGPIVFDRRLDGGSGGERGILVVTSPEDSGRSGAVIHLDGETGDVLERAPLRSAPGAAALVDDRLLVAVKGAVCCFRVGRRSLDERWTAPFPPLRAAALAGDEQGRFFLLDRGGLLLEGAIESGALRELLRLAPAKPLAMAARSGRIFVLAREEPTRARLVAVDPSLRPRPPFGKGSGFVAAGNAVPGDERSKDGAGRTPVLWSVPIDHLALATLAAGPSGVTLARRDSLSLLDAASGATLRTLRLDSPPSALAVGGYSPYLVLESGEVLRYSPSLERVVWRTKVAGLAKGKDLAKPRGAHEAPAGEERRRPSLCDLVVMGERLVAARSGRFHLFKEPSAEGGPAWSHWRGGPGRSGASGGAQAPLDGGLLWTRRLDTRAESAGSALEPPPDSDTPARRAAKLLLPLDGDLLLVCGADGGRIEMRDADGELIEAKDAPGRHRGAVRSGSRVFIARAVGSEGRLLSLSVEDGENDKRGLRLLWNVPLPAMPSAGALAAAGDVVIVALRSSIRAVSAHDGRRLWESVSVHESRSPLIAAGLLVAAGGNGTGGGGRIAALDLGTGEVSWITDRPGSRLGPAALHGDLNRGGLVVCSETTKDGARLFALEPAGGSVAWERKLEAEELAGPVAAAGGRLLVRDRRGRTLLLGFEGEELARRGPTNEVHPVPPVVAFGLVVIAEGSSVRAFDSLGLEPLWESDLPAAVEALVLDKGRVLGLTRKHLFALGDG